MSGFRWGKAGKRFGKYELVQGIAVGGFGEVWLATWSLGAHEGAGPSQTSLQEKVAIKLLVEDVLEEVAKAHAVKHRNIVKIFDFGHEPDGVLRWVAMEHVDGLTLTQLMELVPRGAFIPISAVLDIAIELFEGLHAVHATPDGQGGVMRLVHRDIKPSNVMLSRDGQVKILDFGIAKDLRNDAPTLPSRRCFTPRYAAPEQHRGVAVGPTTDLYSAALVIAELILGHPVFPEDPETHGHTIERLKLDDGAVSRIDAADLGSDGLHKLMRDCLALEPQHRPVSAHQVLGRLRQLREPFPDRPDAESLLRLLQERVLPPDLSTPLPDDWRALVRQVQSAPWPRPVPDVWMCGAPLDLQLPTQVHPERRTKTGVVWPLGEGNGGGLPPSPRPPPPGPPPEPPPGPVIDPTIRQPPTPPPPPPPKPERVPPAWLPQVAVVFALATFGGLLIIGGSWFVVRVVLPGLQSLAAGAPPPDPPPKDTSVIRETEDPPDPPPPDPVCADNDGDTHWACTPAGESDDCDDNNREIYPGAPERCDGLDNDCDPGTAAPNEAVDGQGVLRCVMIPTPAEDRRRVVGLPPTVTCFVDKDGDGFGSTEAVQSTKADCSEAGLSQNSDDCDDTFGKGRTINPDAQENCTDGTDSDCSNDTCRQYIAEKLSLSSDRSKLSAELTVLAACDWVTLIVQFPGLAEGSLPLKREGSNKTWSGKVELTNKQRRAEGTLNYHYTCHSNGKYAKLYYKDGSFEKSLEIAPEPAPEPEPEPD